MNIKWIPRPLKVLLLCAAFWFAPGVSATDAALDTGRIEQLTGLKGTLNQQEGVFKVNFPHKDFQAIVGGNRLIPDQGLTAWAAFTRAGDHTMVMGDIVLLENEVNPVMSAALDNGLEVTAFAGSEQQAIVDGDFAMLEGEVQGVLKALRRANINIVAIHNHMIGESPRYVFLHYWGVGPAEDLAKGLKAALATQSSQ